MVGTGNPTVDFHGQQRSNQTHASTTDPEALRTRKGAGKEAKLSYNGNVLMENRNVAVVQVMPATGTAEREAALMMVASLDGADAMTVGADKGYDTQQFVAGSRQMNATPHIAQKARYKHDRWADYTAGWSPDQSTEAQASRRDLWVDEDDRLERKLRIGGSS
jgi:hypothetical protein